MTPDPAPSTVATAGVDLEATGENIVDDWLGSEHGDEDIDDDGDTIRDWFGYADLAHADLRRRIDDVLGGLRAEVAQLRAEIAQAQAERDKGAVQMCSYCSWEQKLPAPVSALQDHVERDCVYHPLRAVESERNQLRAQVEAMRKALQEIAETVEESPEHDQYDAAVRTGERMREIAEEALLGLAQMQKEATDAGS